jgi:hypothetical protein
MKHKYRLTTITGVIIAFSLVFICRNTNAQPGYRYAPRMQVPYYRSVIVPNPPAQNYQQGYNQYNQMGGNQPLISFSIHFDPLISWFSTDSYDTHSDGVVPGFNFGITHNSYFSPNYSFYSGIDIIKAGGRLTNRETTSFELKNYSSSIFTVGPGDVITYRITYLSIPLGLKLQSNQIGYGRFFTDLGFAPEIVLGSRVDIPSLNISGGNASPELNLFNLSFHVMAGMEYPLAGNNSFIFGIGYDNNLFDITRDNGDQPTNVVTQRMLSIRIGMTF